MSRYHKVLQSRCPYIEPRTRCQPPKPSVTSSPQKQNTVPRPPPSPIVDPPRQCRPPPFSPADPPTYKIPVSNPAEMPLLVSKLCIRHLKLS
ncbi:hypothetical protein P9112_010447 [Eukaryota sp. TZLM1-RC]